MWGMRMKQQQSVRNKKKQRVEKKGPNISKRKAQLDKRYEQDRKRSKSVHSEKVTREKKKTAPSSKGKRTASATVRRKKVVKKIARPSKRKQVIQFLFDVLFYVAMVGIVVGTLIFLISGDDQRSLFGYRFYTVLTDSMNIGEENSEGNFESGDMILVQMTQPEDLEIGDVITFGVGEDSFLTHRLVETMTELNDQEGLFFRTKGDANEHPDPPISSEQVLGKVVYTIPRGGVVLSFVRDHYVVCLIFIASVFGFIWVLRYYFDQPDFKKRQKVRRSVHN